MKNRVLCVIASKGRPTDILRRTLAWIPKVESIDWKVFVEDNEVLSYCNAFRNAGLPTANIAVLPQRNMGLCYALYHAKKYAIAKDYDLVLKLDDDVRAILDSRAKAAFTIEAANKFIADSVPVFDAEEKLGAVRLIRATRAFYFVKNSEKKFVAKNSQLWGGGYIIRPKIWYQNPYYLTDEDCIAGLGVFREGYYTYTYNAGVVVTMYENSGGEQSFNRKANVMETFERLKEEFPNVELTLSEDHPLGFYINYSKHLPKEEKLI